jgi:hypothetical protein
MIFLGFVEAKSNTSLFIYRCDADTVHLLLYVNYIVRIASHSELLPPQLSGGSLLWRTWGLHHFLDVSVE